MKNSKQAKETKEQVMKALEPVLNESGLTGVYKFNAAGSYWYLYETKPLFS